MYVDELTSGTNGWITPQSADERTEDHEHWPGTQNRKYHILFTRGAVQGNVVDELRP